MKITSEIIERVTITGPKEERKEAYDYIENNNFWIIRSGPKKISPGRADLGTFKIVAERKKYID